MMPTARDRHTVGVMSTDIARVPQMRALPEVPAPAPLCTLPVVGETTVEDAVFYVAVGTVAAFGIVPWSTAGLFGALHAIHQRARNVVRGGTFGEARAGLIEAADEVL
jgi:hypothetical protein